MLRVFFCAQMDHSRLRELPSVDRLLVAPGLVCLISRYGRPLVLHCVRRALESQRERLGMSPEAAAPSTEEITGQVATLARSIAEPSLRPVINATGVILHTNLGRAPLGDTVIGSIDETMRGYTNLEFDLAAGRRGQRNLHVAEIIKYLTGAEDAIVVNNNAAAIILVLSTLAGEREVVVSRGELIEIGGAFRIPDIMAAGGAVMREVGTTNRTRLSDFEQAIGPETALLFKAHKSNYSIVGFTEEVSVADLATCAHEHGIPMVYDIGSGMLRRTQVSPSRDEPDVRSALSSGADIVTFSCDKLLGGPQAGVIAGKAKLVGQLAGAPLMRALRVGKLTLAALSTACRHYLSDQDLAAHNPVFAMLHQQRGTVEGRARRLADELDQAGVEARVVDSQAQVGGGSLPDFHLPSRAVALLPPKGSHKKAEEFAERIYQGLLGSQCPVVAVLREGRLLFDVFTVADDQVPVIVQTTVALQSGNSLP